MQGELVPELHDIGKLSDMLHNFEKFPFEKYGFSPDTPTWRGILEHHCSRNFELFPTSPDTLMLCMADDLASAISRVRQPEVEGGPEWQVRKLWRGPSQKKFQFLDPMEIVQFLRGNPSADEYFGRYAVAIDERAEAAYPGMNITTLRTHSELTGKMYRLLKAGFQVNEKEVQGKSREEVGSLIKAKAGQWKLGVSRCRFHFPARPFRTADLGVFVQLEETFRLLKSKFDDHILFISPEEAIFLYKERGSAAGRNSRQRSPGWVLGGGSPHQPERIRPPETRFATNSERAEEYRFPITGGGHGPSHL
ncbi:MAG: hypothetical protein H5T64_13145 [Chloroflexi bacterium]|nr:hypothetical protein [Chloroflexota bacterium]